MRRMIAVPWERRRMLSSRSWSFLLLVEIAAYMVAGIIKEALDTAMREDMADAIVALKDCSPPRKPPAMKQQPRTYSDLLVDIPVYFESYKLTRRMLDSTLPSMLAWTMRISPCLSATILTYQDHVSAIPIAIRNLELLTMSSTAFPNDAFIRPPIVSPNLAANSSVAKLSKDARGTIAKKLRMKTVVGFHPIAPAIIPTGTKTRRILT
jgi:hypothetical protein